MSSRIAGRSLMATAVRVGWLSRARWPAIGWRAAGVPLRGAPLAGQGHRRRWRGGGEPQRLSDDPRQARRLLDLAASLPNLVWGRDELGTGELWNSNSAISWLLARSGLPTDAIRPPAGGRAPGWAAGRVAARRWQSGGRSRPAGDAAAIRTQTG
jgi:hypothetical protein